MAKKSAVQKNLRRQKLAKRHSSKRAELKAMARDRSAAPEERFQAYVMLAKLPRNSAPSRVRNRCDLSGRPRGYYRKFRLSRIALRDLASIGQVPGMVKASW